MVTAEDAQKYCWPPDFQLLPCEVQFVPNGRVAISSYINNLHPRRHAAVYGAIETVMAAAIPLWNRVLVKRDADRLPLRIRTYGPVIEPAQGPPWLDHVRNLGQSHQTEYQAALPLIEEYLAQPEPPAADRLPTSNGQDPEPMPDWSLFNSNFYGFVVRKLDRLRHTVHPQPGASYTYEDWKAGRANRAIVPAATGLMPTIRTTSAPSSALPMPKPTKSSSWNTPTTHFPFPLIWPRPLPPRVCRSSSS